MNKLKIKNNLLTRHLLVGVIAVFLSFVFWLAHYEWSDEMRLWRAINCVTRSKPILLVKPGS